MNTPTHSTEKQTPAYALIGCCDTCGNITAIDFDGSPKHEREMQMKGRTVKRVTREEAQAALRERAEGEQWSQASVPAVEPGHCKEYLVTCESPNGNRWVQVAKYANAHWVEWDDGYDGDDIDEQGGKKWTGWMEVRYDRCDDELIMGIESAVIAWRPKPAAYRAAIDAAMEGEQP